MIGLLRDIQMPDQDNSDLPSLADHMTISYSLTGSSTDPVPFGTISSPYIHFYSDGLDPGETTNPSRPPISGLPILEADYRRLLHRRPIIDYPFFTPLSNQRYVLSVQEYQGSVERTFGRNQVTRYRFIIRGWLPPERSYGSNLTWDCSRSVFLDLGGLLRNGQRDILLTRNGEGVRTRYEVSPLDGRSPEIIGGLSPLPYAGRSNRGQREPMTYQSIVNGIGEGSRAPVTRSRRGQSLEDEFFERRSREDPNSPRESNTNRPS